MIPSYPNIVSKKDNFCKRSSNRPAKVIGLTGGIASGKSTVGRMLSEQNFPVIDTDKLAKEVVEPGKPALKKLVKIFGKEILRNDKTLDRYRMFEMILTDAGARQLVENIIHPYILKRMDQILQQLAASGNNVVIVEVPLLFEAGWQDLFDYVISVVAPESICTKRLAERKKMSIDMASRWMSTQIPQEVKAKRSDYVVHNNAGLDELQIQVNRLSRVLKHLVIKGRNETS
ncbi:MAG: dephospho-CoA kinase [Thermodesulfobacteriota bacterium]|nr:dephospho-CoA kinase [Thermodesulfobacteriota bacterium]